VVLFFDNKKHGKIMKGEKTSLEGDRNIVGKHFLTRLKSQKPITRIYKKKPEINKKIRK